MRITDIFLSVPTVVSGLALASVVGVGITGIVIVVTALFWAWTARVIYGEVLRLRTRVFVDAAIAAGLRRSAVLRRHILPHLYSLILVISALNAASVVSIGAGLSFLGPASSRRGRTGATCCSPARTACSSPRTWSSSRCCASCSRSSRSS